MVVILQAAPPFPSSAWDVCNSVRAAQPEVIRNIYHQLFDTTYASRMIDDPVSGRIQYIVGQDSQPHISHAPGFFSTHHHLLVEHFTLLYPSLKESSQQPKGKAALTHSAT